MNTLPRTHKPIPQIRVLIQLIYLRPPKSSLYLCSPSSIPNVSLAGNLGSKTIWVDPPPRSNTTYVVDADGEEEGGKVPQKIISRNPRIHTLLLPIHNHHRILLQKRKRIPLSQYPLNTLQNLSTLSSPQSRNPAVAFTLTGVHFLNWVGTTRMALSRRGSSECAAPRGC